MEAPTTPDVFAVLFFNDLVRDEWHIEIEPSAYHFSSSGAHVVIRFQKGDTCFSGTGPTLDAAITDARTQVERELDKIRTAMHKLKEFN